MKRNFTKSLISIFVVILSCCSVAKVCAQTVEDGSATHPFLIESKQELLDFDSCMNLNRTFYHNGHTFVATCTGDSCKQINAGGVLPGDAVAHFKLTTDIVLNQGNVAGCDGTPQSTWKEWAPIMSFNGVFDGDYHIVSGVYCNTTSGAVGFFKGVSGEHAVVKNLGVVNSYIKGHGSVGGIAGSAIARATINHCFFEGSIESDDDYTGGIVGLTDGGATITNCYSSGTIYAYGSENYYSGGVVGYNYAGCTLNNCYSNMVVRSDGGSLSGGVYGYNKGDINNCYYDKQMTNRTNNDVVGLVTGEMTSSWTGMGSAFVAQNGFYPYLSGFDFNNSAVRLSVLPIFLYAESSSLFETMEDLHTDFTVGTTSGATWSVSSWNDCATVDNSTHVVSLQKQGIADLVVSLGGHTRTYIISPNLAPFLGSAENPFTIDNLTDLKNFRAGVNGGVNFIYKRFNITYSNLPDIHWLQTADIDLSSVANWTPVGTTVNPYTGFYHGANHAIQNMTITGNASYKGLFGYFSTGVIENLKIENAVVSGASNVGTVCGESHGTIRDCTTEGGSLTGTSGSLGGIVGYQKGGFILRCKNYGTSVQGRGTCIGGIVGHLTGRAEFCLNTADVKGSDETGGICGTGSGSIWYSINTGNISQPGNYGGGTRPVAGILGYTGECHYCINTGTISSNELQTRIAGVVGLNNTATHCYNVGSIICYKEDKASIGSVASSSTATYCLNASQAFTDELSGTSMGSTNYYDITVGVDAGPNSGDFHKKTTAELIGAGSAFKNSETNKYWLFEEGMYPRLAWTDSLDWARDIAIAASTPILVSSADQDAYNVKPGLKLSGCDSNVVWKIQPLEQGQTVGGCLFRDFTTEETITGTCADNAISPNIADVCIGPTKVGAYVNGQLVKLVTLRRYVEPTKDTLTIDSLQDLVTLQVGVNSGEVFVYKDHLVPCYADSVHFLLRTDIDLNGINWTPIADGHTASNRFKGILLGGGYTISNLTSTSNRKFVGLFGRVKGRIQDLTIENVNITNAYGYASYQGAICAFTDGGSMIMNCTVTGSIKNTAGSVVTCLGGIVGRAGEDTILNCKNYATILGSSTASRVGGVLGEGTGSTWVLNCSNAGAVTGNCYAGGIVGTGGTVERCYNTGNITGNSSCTRLGGICGYGHGYPTYCYNVGTITANPGNANTDRYVGGIIGYNNARYCYNAGQIYGNNSKYVGGICGLGNPEYCYNSNTVRSTGSCLASITANGNAKQCYYDKQLSPVVGSYGKTDTETSAYGYSTNNMLGSALQGDSKLHKDEVWAFKTNLYPQLKCFENTSPSISSVMPICLTGEETWKSVESSFLMHGCEEGEWHILQGNCLSLDTTGYNCQTTLNSGMAGVIQLGAAVNDTVYRKDRLLVKISEENPLVIVSQDELKNFRDVINSSMGYYDLGNYRFLTTIDSSRMDYMMEIQDGGMDLYFKLTAPDNDLVMTGGTWTPIGNYSAADKWQFKGTFFGNNRTITGLQIGGGNYQGLFGYAYSAKIQDLTIASSNMTGTGQHKGLICGCAYGCTINNLVAENSDVNSASSYKGVLLGSDYYGALKNCHTLECSLGSTGERAGAICGYMEYGTIDSCYSDHLTVTGGSAYKGGIVGYNYRGNISECQIRNSNFNVSGTDVGGICGMNHSETSDGYAVVKNCSNINTIMKSSTNNLGGIVGQSYHSYPLISNCYSIGGSITTTGSNAGGICGQQYHNNNRITFCYNYNPVKAANKAGGIVGYCREAYVYDCCNYADIEATSGYAGGIAGDFYYYAYGIRCFNSGNILAGTNYAGGISGSVSHGNHESINACFNVGQVTAKGNRAGGITGYFAGTDDVIDIQNSYNAGIVTGVSQVGGIVGCTGNPKNSTVRIKNNYNIGWVQGVSMTGAICGYTPNTDMLSNNYYDLQMCRYAGVGDVDVAGTIAKTTEEMLGSNLSAIGSSTTWTFTEGMYPRLACSDTSKASIASAEPVLLGTNAYGPVLAKDIPTGTYNLGGGDTVSWVRYENYGITIDNTAHTFDVDGRNRVKIANVINGDTLKVVQLVLGVSEEHPIEIKDEEQLLLFRDFINSNTTFYYNPTTMVFVPSDSAGSFIEIMPCGERMFFKLICDVNLALSGDDWIPVGNYSANSALKFKGHFNGGDHVIKGMTITSNGNYQGFFGYLQGIVKNLTVENPTISGTGNYHGALAGYNYGTMMNCNSYGGKIQGSNYVGGLSGLNSYDQMADCYNGNEVKGSSYVGGVAGRCQDAGVITRCFNYGMVTATAANSYVGGITGWTNVEVSHSYNTGVVNGHKFTAGIAGWSETPLLRYCYNAAYVNSDETSYVGAIAAASNSSYYPYYCYYDRQMCTLEGGIGMETTAQNSTNRTTTVYTEDMVGSSSAMFATLSSGNSYWTCASGEYPRLASMEDENGSIVSVKPVFLQERMYIDKVGLPFTVQLGDNVMWKRQGSGNALDINDIDNGDLGLEICGDDTLKVELGEAVKRVVPLHVSELMADVEVDTLCEGQYEWTATGRIYTESVEETVYIPLGDGGCNKVLRLKLTIPPAIEISMASQNRSCYGTNDDYATATITGGFGQGYKYFWTRGADTIAQGETSGITTISNPGPGAYHLTVYDKVHPACVKDADVTITEPDPLVGKVTVADSRCWNVDDGILTVEYSGGTGPYMVSWQSASASASVTPKPYVAGTHTFNSLPDGTYTLSVQDTNGCHTDTMVTIADDDAEYRISAMSLDKMYDGVEVDLARYVVKVGDNPADTIASGSYKVLPAGDTLRATVRNTATVKNVTTQTNSIANYTITYAGEDRSCRYNRIIDNNTNHVDVVISKRDVILTSADSSMEVAATADPRLYNHKVTVGGNGFAPGEDTLSITYTASLPGNEVNMTDNIFDYTLKSNTLADNYDITKVYGKLVVYSGMVVRTDGATRKYNGEELTAPGFTVIGKFQDGDTVKVVMAGSSIIDAGWTLNEISSVTFVRKSDMTTPAVGSYTLDTLILDTLRVLPREVTLTTANASKVYDGTPLTQAVIVGGDGFVAGEATAEATGTITNVGTEPNPITITKNYPAFKDDNYNIVTDEGTLTITKYPLTITGDSRTVAYNGATQSVTTYETNLPTGFTLSGVSYLASGKDPGTYPGGFEDTTGVISVKKTGESVELKGNFSITIVKGNLTIEGNMLPITIVSNDMSYKYDALKHTYYSYTVKYNGTAITAVQDTLFTLPTGDVLTIHPVGKGRGITHVSESGKNDYTYEIQNGGSYGSVDTTKGTLSITKRKVTLTSRSYNEVYTGAFVPARTDISTVTSGSEGFASLPGYAEGVNCTMLTQEREVGVYDNDFSYVPFANTDTNDYIIQKTPGTITITPVTLNLNVQNEERPYGEPNPAFTYTLTGFVNGEDTLSGAPFVGTARPVLSTTATIESPADEYPITADVTGVSFKNYVLNVNNGKLFVRRRTVNIEAFSLTGLTYNGTMRSYTETPAPHYQVTGSGLLEGDTVVSVLITGSRMLAGTSVISLNNAVVKHYTPATKDDPTQWTDVTQSYTASYVPGSITILPVEITLKPIDYTHDFTGHTYNSDSTASPHYTFVSGALVGKDSIVSINISGSRASYGTEDFVIDSASIVMVDTVEMTDYTDINPIYHRNAGYKITLEQGLLTINHRSTPYQIVMQGKGDTLVYDGNTDGQTVSGFVNNVFEFDGFQYRVEGATSKATGLDTGNYASVTDVTSARVIGVSTNEDVTAEFQVTATPGNLRITPRPATIYARGISVEYDGLNHRYTETLSPYCDIVGLAAGDYLQADSLVMSGERTYPGRTPIVIDPSSVMVLNQYRTGDGPNGRRKVTDNYNITIVDSAINITDRTTPYELTLQAKGDTINYDGTSHVLTGFDTLRFTIRAGSQNTPIVFHIDPATVAATTLSATDTGNYINTASFTGTYQKGGLDYAQVLDAENVDVTSQFNVSLLNGNLRIRPRPVTIKANDYTVEFDGVNHQYNETGATAPYYTVTNTDLDEGLVVGHDIEASFACAGQTDVGTTPIELVSAVIKNGGTDVSANYDITLQDGTLEVAGSAKTISIASKSKEYTYDGTLHTWPHYMVTYGGTAVTDTTADGLNFILPTGDTLAITPLFAGVTNVGDAGNTDNNNTFSYTLTNDGIYTGVRDTTYGSVKIVKRMVTLASAGDTKEYDGTPLTKNNPATDITVGGDGFVSGEGATYSITGTQTLVGSSNNTFTYTLDGSTNGDNYTITPSYGSLVVTDRTSKYEITVVSNSDTHPYDGEEKTVSGFVTLNFSENVNGTDVNYKVEGLTAIVRATNAGEYKNAITGNAVVKDANDNDVTSQFIVSADTGKLTITPVAISIKADGKTKAYDNDATTDPALTATVTGKPSTGVDPVYALSRDAGQDVGGYVITVTAEATTNPNYTITTDTGLFRITPVAITIKADGKSKVYDNDATTDPALTATVTGKPSTGVDPVYTLSRDAGQNVGGYVISVTAEATSNPNYILTTDTGLFRITPALITIKADGQTKVYDNDATTDPALTATITGKPSTGVDPVYSLSRDAGQDVGGYVITVTAEATSNPNYTLTTDTGLFRITPALITIKADGQTKAYDNDATTDPALTATVTGKPSTGVDPVYSLSRDAGQDVGGYVITVTAEATSNPNYTITTDTGLFRITPVAITIKADGKSKVYDNDATTDPALTATVTGKPSAGVDPVYTLSRDAGQDVGGYVITVTAEATSNPNYTLTTDTGLFRITPVAVTIKAADSTKVYDGMALTQSRFMVTGQAATDSHTFAVSMTSSSTITDAGRQPNVIATVDGTPVTTGTPVTVGNYTVTTVDDTLTVTPLPTVVTITGHTSAVVYDGSSHSVSGYDMSADNTLYGSADYTFTGGMAYASRTDTGTTYMGLTGSMFANTNPNFGPVTFNVTDGWQRITPITDTVRVTVAGRTVERTYDGVAHTVNGYDVLQITGSSLYTAAYVACDTTPTATRTDSGTTYMGLQPRHFRNTNPNFAVVLFTVTDGHMQILPVTTEVVVEIAGNNAVAEYDNTDHTVTGYTVGHISNGLYTGSCFAYTGGATDTVATRRDAGTDTMAMSAASFANTSGNFTTVRFEVVPGVMEVTPLSGVTVEIAGHTDTLEYNGYERRVTGYTVTSVSNALYDAANMGYTGPAADTVAKGRYTGTYAMGLDGTDFGNTNPNFTGVVFNVTDGSLVIEKNSTEIVITGGSAEKAYDGTPLTCADYTYTAGVIAPGDTLVALTTGSRTEYGTSPNTVSEYAVYRNETLDISMIGYLITPPAEYTKDVTDQYTFASAMVAGTLRITPNGNASVAITGHTAEYNYDGQPHTVSGYDVAVTDTLGLYSETDFIFTGDSVETQTAVGDHPMGLEVTAFQDTSSNYEPVLFTVTDGRLIIYDSLTVTLAAAVTDVTCHGYADGAATLAVAGGKPATPRYSYTVSGPVASTGSSDGTVSLTGLKPGHYLVTVEDALHYTDTASFDIAEPDTLTILASGPADLCPNRTEYAVTALAVGGNGGNRYEWGADATDADADNTVVARTLSNDCGHEYTAAVKVTDSKGCEARDTVRFTVTDTETPQYERPKDTVLYLSATCAADTAPSSTGVAGSLSDNCTAVADLVVTHYDRNITAGCGSAYGFERVWRVTDMCGNVSVVADSVQRITVVDTVRPVYERPKNVTVYKDGLCAADTTPAVTGQPTGVKDNCTDTLSLTIVHYDRNITETCAGSYTFERVWRVVDECGNVSAVADSVQTVTVSDTTRPEFDVPADTVICREVATDMVVNPDKAVTGEPSNLTDNCTDAAALQTNTSYTDVNPSTVDHDVVNYIERHWTVEDACGNVTEKVQRIGVFPAIHAGNTTLKCPDDKSVVLAYGRCDTLVDLGDAQLTTTVTGAGAIRITNDAPAGNRFAVGTTVVTWTATDTCGFTVTCQQTVVVSYPPCGEAEGHEVTYDGHTYKTVRVGCECWLQENLRNTKYADGTDVPESRVYGDDPSNEEGFGLLYTWYSAVKVAEGDDSAVPADSVAPMGESYVKGICPDGWALPTSAQYDDLWRNGYGTSGVKDKDAQYWLPGYAGTDPNCYFNARGAGYYDPETGRYCNLLGDAYFWVGEASTSTSKGKCSVITHTCPEIVSQEQFKGRGQSVRCVEKK